MNILCTVFLSFIGVWLLFVAYFGPYKEYKLEGKKIIILTDTETRSVTVLSSVTGKEKTYTYEEYSKKFNED